MHNTILTCPVELIRKTPFQPRRHFPETEIEELAASIKEVGLIHPPVVREIKAKDRLLYYELIAGERRLLAAKRAGFTEIQVIVKEICDEDAAKASLIENVQRQDLDPIEVAHAFKQLMTAFRLTQGELSLKVGKKRSTVANYLRLLTLPEETQIALSKKTLTMGHAKAILSLPNEERQKNLQEKIEKEQLTVREAEYEASKKRVKKSKDCDIVALEVHLSQVMGRKVAIQSKKDHSGTVTLHFYNLDDFDVLLAVLKST
jgi:ParB family chromosome partitioning protein